MNRKNVVKTICGALLFLLVLPLFYYVGKLNDRMPGDPIQHLVPDEDHIIGVALITDEESQKELLSYTENGICEFYTDEVNSLATLANCLIVEAISMLSFPMEQGIIRICIFSVMVLMKWKIIRRILCRTGLSAKDR